MNTSLRHATWLGAAVLLAPPAAAADWALRLDAASTGVYNHDRQALMITTRDTSGVPVTEQRTGVEVILPRSVNFGFGVRRVEEGSGFGFDFFYFGVTADGITRTASGTVTSEVTFAASDQSYTSTSAADVLYYRLREDNRLEMWTGDLYYIRALNSALELHGGVRFADFDNDYRSVLGIQGTEGTFIDTASNYPRMTGPLVGFNGRLVEGRHRIEAYASQSLVLGRAALGYTSRHFTGTPSAPAFDETRNREEKVQTTIPITDLRLRYTFTLSPRWSVGASANTSAWWDVPVPSGVEPDPNAAQTRQENTVVLYSLLTHVEWRF